MDSKTLIEKLGGPAATAKRLGLGKWGTQRVQNWITRGIPARVLYEHRFLFDSLAVENFTVGHKPEISKEKVSILKDA